MQLRGFFQIGSLFAVLAPLPAAAARNAEINVVVDMTAEGRKVPPPSPGHPVYYLPVMGAYQQRGAKVAGEPPPPSATEIAHLVAVELAKQGYFVTNRQSPPSLVLAFHYGYMNPDTADDSPTGDPSSSYFFNKREMVALVGGETLKNADLNMEKEQIMQGASRDRYFITISAFDFKAYEESMNVNPVAPGRKARPATPNKVLLWQAKMSTPSNAVTLDEVLPVMVKAGGPQFGRESTRPIVLVTPLPEGRVEIGTPEVVGFARPGDAMPPTESPSPGSNPPAAR